MITKINEELCIGCGVCVAICDTVFKMNDDSGKAEIIEGSDCDSAGCCQEAVDACPVVAIILE